MITIPASAATAHGLPAVGLQLDAPNPLMISQFPEEELYVSASGPPGGRLELEVWNTGERAGDVAAVRRAVAQRFTASSLVPKVWGPDELLDIAGARRPAVAFLSDRAMMQTGWCATLVPHAKGTLLVVLGSGAPGATAISCDKVVAHPALAALLRSFRITDA